MKKILFSLSIALTGLLFTGCDELNDDEFFRVIAIDNRCEEFSFQATPSNPKRNILLEDFTGHLCPNCPAAAVKAKELEEMYDGQVIVMAIHPGGIGFTSTTGGASLGITYDFTEPSGTEIDQFFGAGADGLPKGLVNRREFDGKRLLGVSLWSDAVLAAKDLPAIAYVDVQARYQEDDDEIICIDTKVDMLDDYDQDIIVYTSIIEDSIVKPQLTEGAQKIDEYVHMHILRDSPLGAFGVPVGSAPYTANDEFIQRVSVQKDPEWVAKNLKVISYIYDKSTNEILQVSEHHVEID